MNRRTKLAPHDLRSIALGAGLALLLGGTGCMWDPKNGQTLPAQEGPVTADGYLLNPSSWVQVTQLNATNPQASCAYSPIQSGTTPTADATGNNWFWWSQQTTLSTNPDCWVQGPGNTLQSKVRANLIDASTGTQGATLYSFDQGAESCVQQQYSGGGFAMAMNCSSKSSPVVTVNVACGGDGQTCCYTPGAECGAGLICGAGNCTRWNGASANVFMSGVTTSGPTNWYRDMGRGGRFFPTSFQVVNGGDCYQGGTCLAIRGDYVQVQRWFLSPSVPTTLSIKVRMIGKGYRGQALVELQDGITFAELINHMPESTPQADSNWVVDQVNLLPGHKYSLHLATASDANQRADTRTRPWTAPEMPVALFQVEVRSTPGQITPPACCVVPPGGSIR